MAGRRNTTPLFEIVSRNGNASPAPTDKAKPAAPPAKAEPPAKPAPRHPDPRPDSRQTPQHRLPPVDDDLDPELDDPQDIQTTEDAALEDDEIDALEEVEEADEVAQHADQDEDDQDSAETPEPPEVDPAAAERAAARRAARAAAFRAAPREPEAREIPRTMGRISVSAGTVRLPVNYAYVALSAALVLILLTWTLGYMFGGRAADEKARREIETATNGDLRDPLDSSDQLGPQPRPATPTGGSPNPGSGRPITNPSTNPPPTTPVQAPGLPAIQAARTKFLAPGGFFEREPRQEGLNYLCLVSRLPEADAARALDFLARNGVVALGLEHPRSTANNRLFDLFTLEGLTRPEYARENGSTRRQTHEALMAELGRRWRTEERGTSDFGQPAWYRFNP